MEQEETRAIRTSQWLFMMTNRKHGDTTSRTSYMILCVIRMSARTSPKIPEYAAVVAELSARLDEFFSWSMPIRAGIFGREASSSPIPLDPSCGRKPGETTGRRSIRSTCFLGARLNFHLIRERPDRLFLDRTRLDFGHSSISPRISQSEIVTRVKECHLKAYRSQSPDRHGLCRLECYAGVTWLGLAELRQVSLQ